MRHRAVATKTTVHGAACIENGFPGVAFKNAQLGRFVDPSTAAATTVAIGEAFEIQVGGIHEVPRSGNLAAADVGAAAVSDVYINSADNTLGLAAQGLTGAVLNAGWQKFGKVTFRDTTRTPQVLRVNANDLSYVRGTMP
jgi:hypothetical protein